jgi:murein L,D-transpeptidase YafK
MITASAFVFALIVAAAEAPQPKADLIVIDKTARTLKVYAGDQELASFNVALGRESGKKECVGDNKVPEGDYIISGRKEDSAYHGALKVSYPSAADIANAQAKGCKPGGDIMIHGVKNGLGWLGRFHTMLNWTRGCIAVTDEEIERLWVLVPDGTKVKIKP